MFWRRGWFVDSLNYRIEKEFRESIYQNEVYREKRWNLIERQVLPWSSRPFKYAFLLSITCLLWIVLLSFCLPYIKKYAPAWSQPWGDLVNWQSAILGGQLTMIGLVFPLTVGFVGILLSNKSANKALWKIYSNYSGFMFVALSGLGLVTVIVLGQFAHPWLQHTDDIIFSIAVAVWLVFNVCLIGWFLYATFKFIGADSRTQLVLRYCINETLAVEIESRLSNVLPRMVLDKKNNADKEDDREPSVGTFVFSGDNHEDCRVTFNVDKCLRNIYFRPLAIAIWCWRKRAIGSCSDKTPNLILPVSGKDRSYKSWALAFSTGCPLWWLEKLLIRRSYVFGSSPSMELTTLQPVIQALAGDIDDALAGSKARLFKLAIREIEKWHADILAAGAFIKDNKEIDNWLLLGGVLSGTPLQDEFSREYYLIGQSVLQILPQSNRYFESFCYLHLRIYLHNREKLALGIIQDLMQGHSYTWASMMSWHSNLGVVAIDPASSRQFESAIRIFVGSWERWTGNFSLKFERWTQSKNVAALYVSHLEKTARLLISAIRHNEFDAAEWAADMLVHWYGSSFPGREPSQYGWRQDLLVHPLLGVDTSGAIWMQILNGKELDRTDAVRIALRNAWFDIRIATAAYLLSRKQNEFSKRVKKVAIALIGGKRLRPSGDNSKIRHRVANGGSLLQAYLRQRWFWLSEAGGYAKWIDHVVESYGSFEKERHVTGRVYTGWGSQDVRSLRESYMAIAIGYSSGEWAITSHFLEALLDPSVSHHMREQCVAELRAWATPSDKVVKTAEEVFGDEYTSDFLLNYITSVSRLADTIEEKNIQEVVNAPIDEDLLTGIGKSISDVAFSQDQSCVPLSLFSNIQYVDQLDDVYLHSLEITGYQRAQFARGVKTVSAGEETHWLAEYVASDITTTLFWRFYKEYKFVEDCFDDIGSLLDRALVDANTLLVDGGEPIFLVGPRSIQEMLDSVFYDAREMEGGFRYSVRKDDGYPESYICHLDNLEVHQTPFNDDPNCVLLTKDCFESINFKIVEEGQYVEATFVVDGQDPARGSLVLSYWMKEVFGGVTAYKYLLSVQEDED
jgi:hypothetical protein